MLLLYQFHSATIVSKGLQLQVCASAGTVCSGETDHAGATNHAIDTDHTELILPHVSRTCNVRPYMLMIRSCDSQGIILQMHSSVTTILAGYYISAVAGAQELQTAGQRQSEN